MGIKKTIYTNVVYLYGYRSYIRAVTEECPLQIVDHLGHT